MRRSDPQRVSDMLTEIVGMRHRIAHEYGAVNFRIVWAVALEDLPGLHGSLQSLVEE